MELGRLTFVHASDLHIDRVPENNTWSFSSGFQPHDIQLCVGFTEALTDIPFDCGLPPEASLRVVVTGDLTSFGRGADFTAAHTFLGSNWIRSHQNGMRPPAGIALPTDDFETIPGNHDHWDGQGLPASAYRPLAIAPHFRPTPWRSTWTASSGSLELELFGVDSNSGLTAGSFNQRARGRISQQQLSDLENLLLSSPPPVPGVQRVRAILLHHSLTFKSGGNLSRVLSIMQLDQASIQGVLDIAAQHGVAAILTGHTHDAHYHPFSVRAGGQQREVREIRCPTTLQGPASMYGPGFFVHDIVFDDTSGTTWKSWLYEWNTSEFLPRSTSPMFQFTV